MVKNDETFQEKEMREYVEKFIDNFKDRYKIKPVVLYSEKGYKHVTHLRTKIRPVAFTIIEEVANRQLKEKLESAKMQVYPITSRKRKRDVINYKHAVCKMLYDMGYTVMVIGKYLNINHSTVSVAIAKVEEFLSIQDPIFTYIIRNLQNEIEDKTGNIDCI